MMMKVTQVCRQGSGKMLLLPPISEWFARKVEVQYSSSRKFSSHTKGYQAMGSFHSEDVDFLIAQNDEDYIPPTLPFEAEVVTDTQTDFLLDQDRWIFLNHGAFGAALRCGYQRAEQWRLHLEKQPLRYFDRDLLPHLVLSARKMADFAKAPRSATTLIPNVTYGLNTILRGYTRRYGDDSHVVLWDTSYGSLKKIAHQLCANVTEIPLSRYFDRLYEFNDPNDVFEAAMLEGIGNIDTTNALIVLDHTTSNTAINMPLHSLSERAKELKMLVMVDGAHSLLAQPVDLSALPHVDFYLANGHKWLSCPRGIAMMYCPSSELRETILEEPAVMSHGMGQGFQSRFLWDGCRDYAAALSVPAVLDYWQGHGIENVQQEMQSKLESAVKILGMAWHKRDDNITLVPLELHSPMMALVRLPESLQKPNGSTSTDAKRIQDFLFDNFIEVPIKCINGMLYARISCHVYNELEGYKSLAKSIETCFD